MQSGGGYYLSLLPSQRILDTPTQRSTIDLTTRSYQETSPTNPQQQYYRIPNAPRHDNTGNRTQQARPSNTGSTCDQTTWAENQ